MEVIKFIAKLQSSATSNANLVDENKFVFDQAYVYSNKSRNLVNSSVSRILSDVTNISKFSKLIQ